MNRDPHSHKGENGKVAVIGGSPTIHGAPLLAALAAEASGADLIYVAVPKIHQRIARMTSLNFQVYPFDGDDLSRHDILTLLELLATMDVAVIGPGIARTPEVLSALRELIAETPCALVLDASALQPWTVEAVNARPRPCPNRTSSGRATEPPSWQGKTVVLTPHLGELERMGIGEEEIGAVAKEAGITILLKGPEDRISGADGTVHIVKGGNAGLTVGGTGDALAGLVGGLLAQRVEQTEACRMASTVIKKAGDVLFEEKGAFTTRDVIELISRLLKEYE